MAFPSVPAWIPALSASLETSGLIGTEAEAEIVWVPSDVPSDAYKDSHLLQRNGLDWALDVSTALTLATLRLEMTPWAG